MSKSSNNSKGSNQCSSCHKQIFETYTKTAHFNTSSFSNKENIKGSFEPESNTFKLNDFIEFKMISNNSAQFQEAFDVYSKKKIYSLKFDITIGSGRKGQSYLTWHNNELYQQQISYYTATDSWINSPMYPQGKLVQPRPVIPLCLGCHASKAKPLTSDFYENRYDKHSFELGISCERCHGQADSHINKAKQNKSVENTLTKFKNLSRQQRLDACAICHSGLAVKVKNGILNYKLGENISYPLNEITKNEDLDVHGNQYGLLIQSKCFIKSEKMDCMTCHNVHLNERENNFNLKCMSCHSSPKELHQKNVSGSQKLDCISCHMPIKSSNNLKINLSEKDTVIPLKVRSHLIKIYSN